MGDTSKAKVRLGSAEGDLLLAIVYSLYRTIREAERWPAILQQVQELLGAQACSLSIHDFKARTGSIAIHSGCYDDHFLRLYRDRYAAQDPWLKREEHHRTVGSTWLGDELVPQAHILTTEFYRRWMRPQGLMYQCSGVLFRDRQHLVQLTSYRGGRAKPFDRATLYPFQRLLPHIRQTLELQHRFVGAQTGLDPALGELVHRLGATTRVVDAERRLLAASTPAEDTPSLDASPSFGHEHLDPTSERFAEKLHTVLAPSLETVESNPPTEGEDLIDRTPVASPMLKAVPAQVTAPQVHPNPPVIATVNAGPLPGGKTGKESRRWLPVLLAESAPSPRAPELEAAESHEERLRRLYGLTPMEARFAETVACGLGLSSTAQRLGITYETARTHLKKIYGKTDTHQQSELVALMLAGPARLKVTYCGATADNVDNCDNEGLRVVVANPGKPGRST